MFKHLIRFEGDKKLFKHGYDSALLSDPEGVLLFLSELVPVKWSLYYERGNLIKYESDIKNGVFDDESSKQSDLDTFKVLIDNNNKNQGGSIRFLNEITIT